MNIIFRKAKENDRFDIAFCIAEGFKNDFLPICKSVMKTANALQSGIRIENFYVAEANGQVIAVTAVSDCDGRAVYTDKKAYRKNFGLFNGWIAKIILKREFETPKELPKTTGFLECVCVREDFRRQHIASMLIKEVLRLSGYLDFELEVTDGNISAINCYTGVGFKQYKTLEEKGKKNKGNNDKIFMKYKNDLQ